MQFEIDFCGEGEVTEKTSGLPGGVTEGCGASRMGRWKDAEFLESRENSGISAGAIRGRMRSGVREDHVPPGGCPP